MPRLTTGALAPDFTLPDAFGGSHTLSALRGAPVWLAFFRYASCPLCNLRMHETLERAKAGEFADLPMLAVFQSPPASMARYVGKQDAPFPLLCDPSEASYALYGVEEGARGMVSGAVLRDGLRAARLGYLALDPDGTLTRIPADFLIDADGVVRETHYGAHASDHIPFERVTAFARTATRAPARASAARPMTKPG